MEHELENYFAILSEYHSLLEEEEYLLGLMREAEKSLTIEDLGEIAQYIRILIRGVTSIKEKLVDYEKRLVENKPRYMSILEKFKEALETRLKANISISSLVRGEELGEAISIEELLGLYKELSKELDVLEKLKDRMESESLKKAIENELIKIREALALFESHERIISPPVSDIRDSWRLVGYSVYSGGEYVGYINGVYFTLPSLEIVLSVAREEPLSKSDMKFIHAKLYESLITSLSFEEFKEELKTYLRESIQLHEEEILRPSLVKTYLDVVYKQIPKEIDRVLDKKPKLLGYLRYDTSLVIDWENKRIEVKETSIHKDIGKIVYAPDLNEALQVDLDKPVFLPSQNKYTVYHQTWLPLTGNSVVLLTRDQEGLPVPNEDFVKKILIFMESKSTKAPQFESKHARGLDLYWRLRVLIMRSLSDIESITEKRALQPRFVFEFALRKRIPITLSELYQNYFEVVSASYLVDIGEGYFPKVPVKPIPLSAIITNKNIGIYFSDVECPYFLGALVKKNEGIIIECCDKLNEDVIGKISKSFGVGESLINEVSGSDVKKLIRFLMVSGKIKDRSSYDRLITILNKKEIRYDELVNKLRDRASQLATVTLAHKTREI